MFGTRAEASESIVSSDRNSSTSFETRNRFWRPLSIAAAALVFATVTPTLGFSQDAREAGARPGRPEIRREAPARFDTDRRGQLNETRRLVTIAFREENRLPLRRVSGPRGRGVATADQRPLVNAEIATPAVPVVDVDVTETIEAIDALLEDFETLGSAHNPTQPSEEASALPTVPALDPAMIELLNAVVADFQNGVWPVPVVADIEVTAVGMATFGNDL